MYATRGGGAAPHMNYLQDPSHYYKPRNQRVEALKSAPGKARGKGGGGQGPSQTRGAPYQTKPVTNDLLRELLATPGGLQKMAEH